MAIRTLKLNEEWEFQSAADPAKDTEDATVFVLRTLSTRLLSYLQDKSTKFRPGASGKAEDVEADFMQATMAYEVVRCGVKDVRNLIGPDGNAVKWETRKRNVGGVDLAVVADGILDTIPKKIILEVATEIQERNTLKADEVKN